MPRDGSGVYHTPVGTDGVPDTTIDSAKYNNNVHDVETDLNTPRPVVAGGTGATSAAGALAALSGETAKQVVTNWDTATWLPGSFYAATTATGTAPVAGHAFAGIAYYANTTDFVCEATDVNDPLNPDKYVRVMSAGVWGAWLRLNPNTSSANLGEYTFSNQVTFPPGSGELRFNNATQNSTTEVFISHLSPAGVDNTATLTALLKAGVDIVVQDKDEGSKYKVFTATANAVLSGSDFRTTVTLKIAAVDIVTANRVLVSASGATQQTQQRQLIYAAPFDALAYNGMQINGSMEVSQENGATGVTLPNGAVKYVVDGFGMYVSGVAGAAGTQTASTSIPGFTQVLTLACPNFPMTGAGDAAHIYQYVEGYRWSRLSWGTPSAQPVTIGFWVFSPTAGTMAVAVRNGAANRSYIVDVPVTAGSWQYKTVTIPGDTAGTWPTTNGAGVIISFNFGAGSTFTGSAANTWLASGAVATSATTKFFTSGNITIYLTGVVVLPGNEAPSAARSPFIMRPYDLELRTCRRYLWRRSFPATTTYLGILQSFSTSLAGGPLFTLSPEMRAAPTITISNNSHFAATTAGGAALGVTTPNFVASADQVFLNSSTFAVGFAAAGNASIFYVNAAGAWMQMDARL
jgi:hypothetical protein